ncbi:MAG: hypothetical protein WD336_06600 [Trueperaceae bacterium]
MIHGRLLEQAFVRRRAGRLSLLLVLEDPAGGRFREELMPVADDPEAVAAFLGRHLARRGDVDGAPRLRVREETPGGELRERRDLAEVVQAAYAREARSDDRS